MNLIKQTEKIKERNKMKKLKIQFWKAEKALAMQILEQEGLSKCKEDGFVHITDSPWVYRDKIDLRGYDSQNDLDVEKVKFDTNAERDAYLEKVVNAITDELFSGSEELKVGEICEVRDAELDFWEKRKLIAILPEQYKRRFIAERGDYPNGHCSWDCARPIAKCTKPTVEECGQLVTYTWEEK